uniref:Interleukin-12 beta central domain-containing protein n=1 Tax=Laticauda laticaudata TaxID=8630 RepID=A0A8C5WX35_LATLA
MRPVLFGYYNLTILQCSECFAESQWSSDNTAHPEKWTLNCNKPESQHGLVYWKKGPKWVGNGRNLTIRVRGTPDAGNYTCWSNTTHELLSFRVVYITKKNEQGEIDEPILKKCKLPKKNAYFYCEANNYSGNFRCFWKVHSQNPNLKFWIGDENQMKVICDINSEKTNTEYSASCRRENPCSYTEEYEQIELSLHVCLTDVFSCKILHFVNSTVEGNISLLVRFSNSNLISGIISHRMYYNSLNLIISHAGWCFWEL